MDGSELGVIIPALNEEATIASVVAPLAGHYTVIVVDDGSRDATGERAAAAGAHVVRHEAPRGYDGALDTGFATAAGEGLRWAVTIDADGQLPADRVPDFHRALADGAGVVVGVRPAAARIGEALFAIGARLRFGIRDPMCGMKGYDLAYHRSLGHFDRYGSIGTELMLHAVRSGARVVQIPITVRDRADAPRFGRALRANARILRAAWIGLRPGVRGS